MSTIAMADIGNLGSISRTTAESVAELMAEIQALKEFNANVTQPGQELIAAQTRLQSLLHKSAEGIITLNPDGTAESFNLAAQQIFGYSEAEIITKNISHLIPCPEWANGNVTSYLNRFSLDPEFDDIPLVGIHKNNHEILLHLTSTEMRDDTPEKSDNLDVEVWDIEADVRVGSQDNDPIVYFLRDITGKEPKNHRFAFDAMAGIIVRNADFTLYSVNEKMAHFMGMGVDELMAHPELLEPYSNSDVGADGLMKSSLVHDGFCWHSEVCYRTKKGKFKWFSQAISIVKDDDLLYQYHILVFDITERKQSEQALKDRQAALDHTIGVTVTDADGFITYVNDKFCEHTQYSREELIGQNHRILNSGHHLDSFWQDMYEVASEGKPWRHKICNQAKDGSIYWIDMTVIGYHDQLGELVRYVAIRMDITNQEIVEENLQFVVDEQTKELRAAEAANNAKSSFLVNMSHELRTPMHSILSFSEFGLTLIRKASVDQKNIEKVEHFFSNINESGQRLMGLLNNLLDLAKLEAGKMSYAFKLQDLRHTTETILTEFSTKLMEKDLQLEVIVNEQDTMAYYDNDKIAQVIANLVSNAIKFTAESSKIKIVLDNQKLVRNSRIGEKVEMMRFRIFDQGIGVPEDELETIFDQFIQSYKIRHQPGGTGLGLAICKEIIEAHRGSIWAENNPDAGASVCFVIHKS